jgi:hypothetical protein
VDVFSIVNVSSPADVSKSTRQREIGPDNSTKDVHALAARSAASTNESGNSVGWDAFLKCKNLYIVQE